jgi:hypothetical protein
MIGMEHVGSEKTTRTYDDRGSLVLVHDWIFNLNPRVPTTASRWISRPYAVSRDCAGKLHTTGSLVRNFRFAHDQSKIHIRALV